MPDRPAIKICGLQRREDVVLADRLGARYVGLVLSPGFGRSVEPGVAAELTEGIRATKVAVLVDETAASAASLAATLGAGVLQLHGSEPPEVVADLSAAGPWRVWKAIRAGGVDDLRRGVEVYGDLVDGFLLEGAKEGVVGGGGARLDLDPVAVADVLSEGQLFVLAGGLTAETVRQAVARYMPDVVDVSSGIESRPGGKDPERMKSFFEAVQGHREPTR